MDQKDKDTREYMGILRRTDMFYDLTDPQLEMVASICSDETYRKGQIIFDENSAGDELYVIAAGEVEIKLDPSLIQAEGEWEGESVTIANLKQGQTFGEVALVDQGLRTASAWAVANRTRLLSIPRERLILLCDNYPELGYRVMRNVAADLAFKVRGTDLLIREQLLWQPREAQG